MTQENLFAAVTRFRFPSLSVHSLLGLTMTMMLVFGSGAHAASGLYLGAGGGFSLMEDSELEAPSRTGEYSPFDAKASIDTGHAVRGSAGYAFANGLRIEAEIAYLENDIARLDIASPGSFVLVAYGIHTGRPPSQLEEEFLALPAQHRGAFEEAAKGTSRVRGDVTMLAFWANAFYDFDLQSAWKPYVGGGLGFANIEVDAKSGRTGSQLADDDDTVFTYQAGAGIGYEFSGLQGYSLTATLDWRYFDCDSPSFRGSITGGKFDTEMDGQYIGAGVRYSF